MNKTGSVSTILSSSITNAYAWLRDQRDERGERLDEQGADRTAQCLRSADGVFRAPLAVFIDRSDYVKTEEDAEDLKKEEDKFPLSAEDFDRHFGAPNDHYAQLADHLGIEEEDDVERTYDDSETGPVSSATFVSNHESNNPAVRHITDGKTVIRVYNRYLKLDRKSWKATTPAPKQCLRHA